MATAVTAQFRFFDVHVLRSERLGPSMVRITFGGADVAHFASGGRDQSLSLFLPHPGQEAPVMPTGDDWFAQWRALDPSERAVLRSYTARQHRPEQGEFDIDFVLHGVGDGPGGTDSGTAGPASRWAAGARPGHRLIALGPAVPDNTGVRFRLPEGTDRVLIAADSTALPAAAAILESLPAGLPAQVWLDIPHPDDRQTLLTVADAEVSWLTKGAGPALLEAVRAAELPPAERPYAWIAGEAGTVRELRRHLVGERGFHRRAVTFVGYWRRGSSEDQLRAEAEAGAGT